MILQLLFFLFILYYLICEIGFYIALYHKRGTTQSVSPIPFTLTAGALAFIMSLFISHDNNIFLYRPAFVFLLIVFSKIPFLLYFLILMYNEKKKPFT